MSAKEDRPSDNEDVESEPKSKIKPKPAPVKEQGRTFGRKGSERQK